MVKKLLHFLFIEHRMKVMLLLLFLLFWLQLKGPLYGISILLVSLFYLYYQLKDAKDIKGVIHEIRWMKRYKINHHELDKQKRFLIIQEVFAFIASISITFVISIDLLFPTLIKAGHINLLLFIEIYLYLFVFALYKFDNVMIFIVLSTGYSIFMLYDFFLYMQVYQVALYELVPFHVFLKLYFIDMMTSLFGDLDRSTILASLTVSIVFQVIVLYIRPHYYLDSTRFSFNFISGLFTAGSVFLLFFKTELSAEIYQLLDGAYLRESISLSQMDQTVRFEKVVQSKILPFTVGTMVSKFILDWRESRLKKKAKAYYEKALQNHRHQQKEGVSFYLKKACYYGGEQYELLIRNNAEWVEYRGELLFEKTEEKKGMLDRMRAGVSWVAKKVS